MNLIKSAIIYQADLPAIDAMMVHLAEIPFLPVKKSFISGAGFVLNSVTGELVTPIEGGYSFSVRHDEKILPREAVLLAIATAIEDYALNHEMELDQLSEDEVMRITDQVRAELIENALIKSTVINCFYSVDHQYLILPTTKKDLANVVVSLLIKSIGSVKTSTIHVDDIKGGLTTRLRNHLGLNGDGPMEDAFSGFKLGATCNMIHKSDKVSFSLSDLDAARLGMIECLEKEMKVDIMELTHEGVGFKLTHDFKLKGLSYFGELTEDEMSRRDDADEAYLWRLIAATQLLQVVALINALCVLFSYKRPVLAELEAAKADADVVYSDEPDPLYSDVVGFVRENNNATTSAIQKAFKVGYNRATRLIERLIEDGVITPSRDVYQEGDVYFKKDIV